MCAKHFKVDVLNFRGIGKFSSIAVQKCKRNNI